MGNIERDRWEVATEAEFRSLVNNDPDEAVFGFRRLQTRVRDLRANDPRGAVETLERIAALRDGKPVLDQVGMYQIAADAIDHIRGQ